MKDSGNKLVVNSLISPDSVVVVNLSKSQDILANDQIEYVNNASISLYEDGQFIQDLTFNGDGSYYSYGFNPDFGKKYSVMVNAPGIGTASGADIIPMPVSIINIDTSTVTGEWNNMLKCKIRFHDNPAEKNYYLFSIKILVHSAGSQYYVDNIYFGSDDPVVEESMSGSGGLLFSDEKIDGQTYDLSVYLNKDDFNYSDTTMLYFNLNSVTRDFFMYARSYTRHINAQGDPFAEPVQVFNNIEGGYGIFAGFCSSVDSLAIIGGNP
jgi:hypothetical protein